MKLRDYQERAVDAILEAFQDSATTLLVMATGLGKTVVFAHIIDRMKGRGRAIVLAHREELIAQAWEKIRGVTGVEADVEMANCWASEAGHFTGKSPIVVSSIQTQCAGRLGGRMQRFDPREFGLCVIDEAHHSTAASYRRVINYYRQNPDLRILGVTATPDRADEAALGQIYQSVAFEYGINDGITDGWLVPIRQQFVAVDGLDFSQCRTTAGDLNGKDLAQVMEYEQTLHGYVGPLIEIAGDRRTLVFGASVAQAERIAEIINRHRPDSARCVFGRTPKEERREIIGQYRTGCFQTLVNVGVATEGFDVPGVEVIVMARPTKSRSLYAQMLGRATRPLPGIVDPIEDADGRRQAIAESTKPSMLVLDFVGNSGRHKLVSSADILGGKYDDAIVERARRQIEKKGDAANVDEELVKAERAEREAEKRRQAARRAKIRGRATYSTRSVSPFDILDITAQREPRWHHGRQPTPKQIDLLERHGVDVDGQTGAQASQLIGEIIERRQNGKCTYKQVKLLARYGYGPDVPFPRARELIDALARNGWKKLPSEAVCA